MKNYTDSVVGLVICVAYYNLLSSMDHELAPLKNYAGQHSLVELAQNSERIKNQLASSWCAGFCPGNKELQSELREIEENKKEHTKTLACIHALPFSPREKLVNLSDRNLQVIPEFSSLNVAQLDGISVVDISGNRLQVLPLGDLLRWCDNLKTLKVANNQIEFITYRSSSAPYFLVNHRKIKELDLSHNRFKEIECDNICTSCPKLKILNLSYNRQLASCSCHDLVHCNGQFTTTIDLRGTMVDEENTITPLRRWYLQRIRTARGYTGAKLGAALGFGFLTLEALGVMVSPMIFELDHSSLRYALLFGVLVTPLFSTLAGHFSGYYGCGIKNALEAAERQVDKKILLNNDV
jgi:Leucine Rich Repeat (LRR) protein